MIKISRLADYAVVVVSTMSKHNGVLLSASNVAEQTHLPEPTVSKVLKILAKHDIVDSIRGANGGYKLSKPSTRITVADIITAIEGPVSLTACVEGAKETCDFSAHCPVNGRWDDVNMAIRVALESITLADMIAGRSLLKPLKDTKIHERL